MTRDDFLKLGSPRGSAIASKFSARPPSCRKLKTLDTGTLSLVGVIIVQTGTVCFFMGVLSSKVTANANRIEKLEQGEDHDGDRRGGIIERLVRVESELQHLKEVIEPIRNELRGLSRQVASLATRDRPGAIPPLMDAQGK